MYLVMLHWVTELTRARAAFSWVVTGLLGLPYDHGLDPFWTRLTSICGPMLIGKVLSKPSLTHY